MSGSSSADAEGSASGTAAPTTFSLKEEEEEEEVIPSDDDGGVPSNKDHLEPGERVRRARHPDGSTTMVRVEGGWMVRKKQKVDHYPGGASASATDISATAAAYAETAHPAGASAEETAMSLAEEEDRMQRVLAKAAEKGEAPFVSVSVRYKNEAIEAAVNAVQSSSHRRKPTFSASALSSIASSSGIASPSAANGAAGETAAAELREAYRINPSLCYLPMEDGGIRFTSVSFAPVPRSLHPLCAANLMCGYCMTVTPPKSSTIACALRDAVGAGDDNAVGVRGGAKSSSKKSKKSSTPWVAPEVDRYALTSKAYGAVTYRVHKQCTDANASDVLQQELQHLAAFNGDSGADGASNISETLPVVTLGEVYEYEQAEDAECDLCGRKGGVLQYFHIHASRSSILPPTEDGWLAHIPCLHFLHSSNLLRRIDGSGGSAVSSAAVADTSDAAAVGQQALSGGSNPFSNCVGADSYATAQPSESTLLGNSVENREGARLEEGGADAVEEVDDAVKERLQQENRLHPRPPLSLFDQLFGHWRCAICGLQCGLAVRCVSAACAVRVHPLCATALNSPNWQICSVETAEGDVVEKEGQSSMCVLCPLHSAGLSKSKVV